MPASAFAVFLIGAVAVYTAGLYVDVENKRRKLAKEEEGIRERARQKAQEIIDEARQSAVDMSRTAHVKVEEALEKATQNQVEAYSKTLEKVAEQIEGKAVSEVEKEVAAYKARKLERIDGEVREMVREISREVLGKSISLEQHEDLVIKALEEAKKRHVI